MPTFSDHHSAYGTYHICVLIACVILIFLLAFLLRKKEIKVWYRILLVTGIVSETLKLVSYILANEKLYGGYLPKTDLPLQLCSIQLVLILILNVFHNEKLNRFLLAFMLPTCLVGGFAALVIPTGSSLNMPTVSVQYFLYHSVIVAFAIYLLGCKEIKWEFRDYINSLVFLALFSFAAIYFNSMFYEIGERVVDESGKVVEIVFANRVNFMYVVDPPAEGLPFLNKDHGWLVYIIHYGCLAVTAVSLVFIKPVIAKIKQGRKKTAEA